MPLVTVTLVEGVFSTEEKHAMAAKLTDVMVGFEGSEAFREVVWVLIQELKKDGWHIGGQPFAGPASLVQVLRRSKEAHDVVVGGSDVGDIPTSRDALATRAPVQPR
ncbi:MAG TPA: tautomerase family protein [Humisphaera sp.]